MLQHCFSTSYDKRGVIMKNKIFASDEKRYTKQQLVVSKHFAAIKTQLLWLTEMKRNNALVVVKEDLTTDGLYGKKTSVQSMNTHSLFSSVYYVSN